MKTVIFLDIDGVLNRDETPNRIGGRRGIEGSLVWKLREIVLFLNADIVLSSSWKNFWDKSLINDGVDNWRGRSPKRYGRYLNLRLGKYGLKISDKTDDFCQWTNRPEEIRDYIDRHPEIDRYVILDDEDFSWEELADHVVKTQWEDSNGRLHLGLNDENVNYIKENIIKFNKTSA